MVMLVGEYQFLTAREVIRRVAIGQHLNDARLQYGKNFSFSLGCCICQHGLREHVCAELWEHPQVTHNGRRCCATTLAVPVKLVHVEREEERFIWPD